MANILVYIELEDGDASPVSLSALNLGRKVASRLGAALYAILPCNVPPTYEENDVITVISQHGADKVILLTDLCEDATGVDGAAAEKQLAEDEKILGEADPTDHRYLDARADYDLQLARMRAAAEK